MTNYMILSGWFKGHIVTCEEILDVSFEKLPEDLQNEIKDWAEKQVGILYNNVNPGLAYIGEALDPITMDEIKRDYEQAWETEETTELDTLQPFSMSTYGL